MRFASPVFGGLFEVDHKIARCAVIQADISHPDSWQDLEKMQTLNKERVALQNVIDQLSALKTAINDNLELYALALSEEDTPTLTSIAEDVAQLTKAIEQLECQRMFSQPMDKNSAYMDIQAGSGGTEAQDWADMILRMYLRWGEKHGFKTELIEASSGEVVGIKSATIAFEGEYAYGWLRTESGVHRLVRKSPFDANHKRHTSFASVFVSPMLDDNITIEINPADLRIDTYRAGGAGGQHVNRTDSAVRITHVPTNTVAQCQSDRSQHKNKAQAMKLLRAKLYELERQKQNEKRSHHRKKGK